MQQNGYNEGSKNYSNPEIERDLQRLEAEHNLYELFDDFISGYDEVDMDAEGKVIYLGGNNADKLVDNFIDEYGEDFLESNPELTEEDCEFYRDQPDDLYNEIVREMVEEYIAEGDYFEAEFQNNTERFQKGDSSNSALRSAAKTVLAGGLIVSGMLGTAAADSASTATPIKMDEGALAKYSGGSAHSDADNDGLPDSYEEDVLSDADPEQRDVFVEVDYSSTCDIDEDFFKDIERMYANAPIENPDGSQGINLHMIVDDELELDEQVDFREQSGSMNDRPEIMNQYFDSDGLGVHHMLLVDNAANDGKDVLGTAVPGSTVVECGDRSQGETLRTASHELGHSQGLSSSDFKGVDSRDIPFEEYPSAMNYNSQGESPSVIEYSDGTNSDQDFNDWKHLERNQETPQLDSEVLNED